MGDDLVPQRIGRKDRLSVRRQQRDQDGSLRQQGFDLPVDRQTGHALFFNQQHLSRLKTQHRAFVLRGGGAGLHRDRHVLKQHRISFFLNPLQEPCRYAFLYLPHFLRRADGHNPSAFFPAAGAHIRPMVGSSKMKTESDWVLPISSANFSR